MLLSRRRFIQSTAAFAAAPVFSRRLLAGRVNEQLHVACVGVGGMGGSDLRSVASAANVTIVALCDVDRGNLASAAKDFPDAKTFTDYRRMLDAMAEGIDAVVVSTPDHMHAPVALAAMSLGKHVYCQKPIAHNPRECRAMTLLAADKSLVTQMGTQIHALAAYRTAVASVRAGAIGKVREAHLWVSKSWAGPAAGRPDREDAVPDSLDWDLWLGGAPERPFVSGVYHPASWRGWRDFGCGTLGDMGCHIFDPVFSALELGAPQDVISKGPRHHAETFAADSDIQYTFPETPFTDGPLRFRWTDGSAASRPDASRAQLPDGASLPGAGSFLVGERGVMVIPHWDMPVIYADGERLGTALEVREDRNHYHEWADACRGIGEASTPFSYSGPLTEAVLVGTIAGSFRDHLLAWDSAAMQFDHAAANEFVGRKYRDGWGLPV